MPVESYPWRFSSVISVGSHEAPDPLVFYANPEPPVEFFARGVDVDVAWLGGATIRCTGNSFATPHIAGICALIARQAPGADAVPAQERALPDRDERRRQRRDDDRLRAAVAAGVLGVGGGATARCCGRSSRSRARSSARRRRRSSCSTRRPTSSSSRPWRARARTRSSAGGSRRATGIAGWVLVTRQPLVLDDVHAATRASRATSPSRRATCRRA